MIFVILWNVKQIKKKPVRNTLEHSRFYLQITFADANRSVVEKTELSRKIPVKSVVVLDAWKALNADIVFMWFKHTKFKGNYCSNSQLNCTSSLYTKSNQPTQIELEISILL